MEEFKRKGFQGDHIAVGISGSNQSTALYAAISVLKLNPAVITAVSSASYGANREDYTWLDIEAVLKKKKLIDFSSSYASLGGKDDLAIGLSDNGLASLRDAMTRNGVPLLLGSTLEENVSLREAAYKELLPEGQRYRMFVNIGGGLANVGSEPNSRLIPEGINHKLAEKEFEKQGIMMVMATSASPSRAPHSTLGQRVWWPPRERFPPGEGPAFGSRSTTLPSLPSVWPFWWPLS